MKERKKVQYVMRGTQLLLYDPLSCDGFAFKLLTAAGLSSYEQ